LFWIFDDAAAAEGKGLFEVTAGCKSECLCELLSVGFFEGILTAYEQVLASIV
jgi:hypothetical protein